MEDIVLITCPHCNGNGRIDYKIKCEYCRYGKIEVLPSEKIDIKAYPDDYMKDESSSV